MGLGKRLSLPILLKWFVRSRVWRVHDLVCGNLGTRKDVARTGFCRTLICATAGGIGVSLFIEWWRTAQVPWTAGETEGTLEQG